MKTCYPDVKSAVASQRNRRSVAARDSGSTRSTLNASGWPTIHSAPAIWTSDSASEAPSLMRGPVLSISRLT